MKIMFYLLNMVISSCKLCKEPEGILRLDLTRRASFQARWHLVAWRTEAVQQVQVAETATCSPLQRLWRVCHDDGPPLPAARHGWKKGDWIHCSVMSSG